MAKDSAGPVDTDKAVITSAEMPAAPRVADDPDEREPHTAGSRLRAFGAFLVKALILLIAFFAMVAFAVFLARITLTPVPGAVGSVHHNLTPGNSLRFYLDTPARDAIRQVGGNIVLGVPFGVLLPLLFPGIRGFFKVCLVTAVGMLLVELVQGFIITGRAFDIDDVILNTTGALLGFLFLGRRIMRAVHGRRRRA